MYALGRRRRSPRHCRQPPPRYPVPTQQQVLESVIKFVAGFAHLPVPQIDPDRKLTDPPLNFDDNQLAFLAMSLRGYARSFNPDATVLAADTRKPGQTSQSLATLVFQRITG